MWFYFLAGIVRFRDASVPAARPRARQRAARLGRAGAASRVAFGQLDPARNVSAYSRHTAVAWRLRAVSQVICSDLDPVSFLRDYGANCWARLISNVSIVRCSARF